MKDFILIFALIITSSSLLFASSKEILSFDESQAIAKGKQIYNQLRLRLRDAKLTQSEKEQKSGLSHFLHEMSKEEISKGLAPVFAQSAQWWDNDILLKQSLNFEGSWGFQKEDDNLLMKNLAPYHTGDNFTFSVIKKKWDSNSKVPGHQFLLFKNELANFITSTYTDTDDKNKILKLFYSTEMSHEDTAYAKQILLEKVWKAGDLISSTVGRELETFSTDWKNLFGNEN